MEISLCQVNSFFQQQRLSSHLLAQSAVTPPVMSHMTSHRTDCPGAARVSFFLSFFLQPNKGTAGCQLSRPFSVSSLSSFHSLHLSASLFARARGLPPFEVVLFCFWRNACHYSRLHLGLSQQALVLKYECKSASAQQTNKRNVTEKNIQTHVKATVLHYNQY